MPSHTAASTSARESLFRIQAPNAMARDVLVVALDAASACLSDLFSAQAWPHVCFVNFAGLGPGQGWRAAMASRRFDVAVLLGVVGGNFGEVAAIGAQCQTQGVKLSGILLAPSAATQAAIADALQALRPWSRTLTLLQEPDDLPGILQALGAAPGG